MRKKMKKCMLFLTMSMAAMLLCSCGGSDDSAAEDATAQSQELQKVTVILDWTANPNHAGMYVAKDQGYYEEAGLDVEIVEPTDGATPTLIAQGKGDFGISYQEDVTIALTSEDPLPIKTIATIMQHNTSGFVSLAGSGIESPKDFEGKTYAGWAGAGESAVLEGVMTEDGADFSKLNMVVSDGSGFESLGKSCDLMWFFEGSWDYVMAEKNGVHLDYLPCNELDERLDYYTPVIITSDSLIEEDPELVKAFLDATSKGYEYSVDHVEETVEILSAAMPDYEEDVLTQIQQYLSGKYIDDASQWGIMEDDRWDNYTEFLNEYGVIDQTIPASDCYTNEFLPER